MEKVIIFDTTLRDGEQSPGASLNTEEKIQIARALAAMGADVIEAGFPISSPGDFEAVQKVSKLIKGAVICGLARCIPADIDAAGKALKPAKRGRIHVFLATSKIHRQFKLKKAKEEIIAIARAGIQRARKYTDDVEFSPEDAARTEPDYLAQVVEEAIRAGARTVNIPDTVGYSTPDHFKSLVTYLFNNVPNIDKAVISVHCHNDLGLAVANSLAAVSVGARQIECTINGLGERAGNCSLEEVVMALAVRKDIFKLTNNIDTTKLYPLSRLVSTLTGIQVQRNKAIVGENAFAHEAGIHQDGVLKKASTYEIMRPEDVGLVRNQLVLGKHSGRHAFGVRVKELGFNLTPEQLERAFAYFKDLADKKKEIYDEDITAIIEDEVREIPRTWELVTFHTSSGSNTIPTATVRLKHIDGTVAEDAACGDGPVDAIYKTLERMTGVSGKLEEYSIRAVTSGKEAMGEVNLAVHIGGKTVRSRAISTDIIEASAKAYLHAINSHLYQKNRTGKKAPGK